MRYRVRDNKVYYTSGSDPYQKQEFVTFAQAWAWLGERVKHGDSVAILRATGQ